MVAMNSEPSSSKSPTKKRKRNETAKPSQSEKQLIDLTINNDDLAQASPSKKSKKGISKNVPVEKRLRRYRDHPPASYMERLDRATTQRMFVVDRSRSGTEEDPEEVIDMAGTTGNLYSITIRKMPSCTCPDNQKGNQCKHIVYVMHNVLKAPEHLQYQLAFLSSELREIFASAPIPTSSASPDDPSNRKEVTGDCPICFTAFEPESDDIVWCKAACGNNIHRDCFEQWAKSQAGKQVNCVYCRTPWQGDEESLRRIKAAGKVNGEGYMNVAGELGLSGARDYSTYHQPWVRRQGHGYY